MLAPNSGIAADREDDRGCGETPARFPEADLVAAHPLGMDRPTWATAHQETFRFCTAYGSFSTRSLSEYACSPAVGVTVRSPKVVSAPALATIIARLAPETASVAQVVLSLSCLPARACNIPGRSFPSSMRCQDDRELAPICIGYAYRSASIVCPIADVYAPTVSSGFNTSNSSINESLYLPISDLDIIAVA